MRRTGSRQRHRTGFVPLAVTTGMLLVLTATGRATAETAPPPQFTGSIERHFTTNAMDGVRAISDWYTLLRGSLHHEWGGKDASASLDAQFQATRYDTVKIEDDHALTLTAQAFRRLRPGLELRGTLTYSASNEGDDFTADPFTLGTRTPQQVFGAQAQLGIDLGNATSLVLEAGDGFEKIGLSRFRRQVLPAVQLDADRNRLQFGFRLARTLGRLTVGASGTALPVSVQRLGSPPVAIGFRRYALRGELTWTGPDGSTLGVAAGGEWLDAENGLYSRVRPTWQVAFAKPLPHDFELRGSYCGRFEDADSDDPLASWLQRAELEAALKIGARLALSAGLFWQDKQNLLFENTERSSGFYAEATYRLTESTTAVLRVDASKTFTTVVDTDEETVDMFLGWRASL